MKLKLTDADYSTKRSTIRGLEDNPEIPMRVKNAVRNKCAMEHLRVMDLARAVCVMQQVGLNEYEIAGYMERAVTDGFVAAIIERDSSGTPVTLWDVDVLSLMPSVERQEGFDAQRVWIRIDGDAMTTLKENDVMYIALPHVFEECISFVDENMNK